MKICEILDILNEISPFSLQESWDNSGLILGAIEREFSEIFLSLECDLDVIYSLPQNALLITHHPLIFSPLKTLNLNEYQSKILEIAIAKNIQLIALHTNFDKSHFGKFVVGEILGIKEFYQDENDFAVRFTWGGSFLELCELCKNKLKIHTLKFTQAQNTAPLGKNGEFFSAKATERKCENIALITGSGAGALYELSGVSLNFKKPYEPFSLDSIKSDSIKSNLIESKSRKKPIDCLITGDIKYHNAMEAMALGIHLIDCGHYELEAHFGHILAQLLTKKGVRAKIADSKNPFSYL